MNLQFAFELKMFRILLFDNQQKLNQTRYDLDGVQQRILDTALRAAKLGGVELTGKNKEKFNEIRLQLAKLANNFRWVCQQYYYFYQLNQSK